MAAACCDCSIVAEVNVVATPTVGLLVALRALADPLRLAIVEQLAEERAWAYELRERLGVSAPLLSHHVRVLRQARLVNCRRDGRRLELELRPGVLEALAAALPVRER